MNIKLNPFWSLLFLVSISCTKTPDDKVLPEPDLPGPAIGLNSYCVSVNGKDSNPGTLASPWRTLNASIAKLIPGDSLYVRRGTYKEVVEINISGTESAPVTISAYNSELPVIDGENKLPVTEWTAMVNMNGNYICISGFEVKNTANETSRGVNIGGHHNTVSNFNVHHIQDNGILIQGDYGIVEDSRVWQACYNNVNNKRKGWASGLSAARDHENGITDNAIIRRNTVYNNWGEGLSTYEAQGTLIEDNIVYDNYAQNVYISDASNVMFRRNMVYSTPDNVVGVQRESSLADEVSKVPRSANNTLINNFFLNVDLNAFSWTIVAGSGLKNVLIANNTFVNSKLNTGIINSGNRIINNIFTTSGNISYPSSGITWSNNLWQESRPVAVPGTDDVIGDPKLALTGSRGPGSLKADFFKLLPASPAIDKATVLPVVTEDYFKITRGTSPDIGAHEF